MWPRQRSWRYVQGKDVAVNDGQRNPGHACGVESAQIHRASHLCVEEIDHRQLREASPVDLDRRALLDHGIDRDLSPNRHRYRVALHGVGARGTGIAYYDRTWSRYRIRRQRELDLGGGKIRIAW